MNLPTHLATDIEKIQSGVSRTNARSLARRYLDSHVESSSLDADLILAFACGLSRFDLLLARDEELTSPQAQIARELLRRRAQGEPVAYLLGSKEFYGLDFHVNPHVLIPRPDTEVLVEAAIEILKKIQNPKVIDVCTGSGCIAIAIADQVKTAQVIAVDISEQALIVARKNVERHGLGDRVKIQIGNLLAPVMPAKAGIQPKAEDWTPAFAGVTKSEQVDMIVANPPYILAHEIPGLMRDVRDFEPHLALLAEAEDGLGLHCKILEQSLNVLKPGGVLFLEIGAGQAELFSNKIFFGFTRPEFLKDYGGILRVAKLVRLGMNHG